MSNPTIPTGPSAIASGRWPNCTAAASPGCRPEPRGLAARLLALQRLDDWDLFPLATTGRRLEPPASASTPPWSPRISRHCRNRSPRGRFGTRWTRDFPVVHRMEKLAEQLGDTDLLISVIARDLSNGHAYARLVRICADAGRADEALDWAERGYRHHPDWGDMRVLLADQYRRAGRVDESIALTWEEFQDDPGIESWRRLKQADRRNWPEHRRRALSHVEADERRLPDGRRNVSLRLQLLVADRDLEAARVLGESEAADAPVLEHLARAVSRAHPIAAAGFLRRAIEATLPRMDAKHYAAVVAQVRQVQSLQPDAVTAAWIADLKARYRSRRKLMALLEG